MSEKQLNFINIFDEAAKEYKEEKERSIKEALAIEAPKEVEDYWQIMKQDENLFNQRLAIIRANDEISLEEFSPFMIEINWYAKRMAHFYSIKEKSVHGKDLEECHYLVVNPQMVDKKYSDTASLYLKYKSAFEIEQKNLIKEEYQLKIQKEKERRAELKKAERLAGMKIKRKKDREEQNRLKQENELRSQRMKRIKKFGSWAASGEYLEDQNND